MERHDWEACCVAGPGGCRLPQVGFPDAGGQRRARGLRREELASLACVSPDHIKRLEQGRARPSATVLDSLARALRLTRAEYEYFCVLAGHVATGTGQLAANRAAREDPPFGAAGDFSGWLAGGAPTGHYVLPPGSSLVFGGCLR